MRWILKDSLLLIVWQPHFIKGVPPLPTLPCTYGTKCYNALPIKGAVPDIKTVLNCFLIKKKNSPQHPKILKTWVTVTATCIVDIKLTFITKASQTD